MDLEEGKITCPDPDPWSSFPLNYTVAALVLINCIHLQNKARDTSKQRAIIYSRCSHSCPFSAIILPLCKQQKVTYLLAHIQLCLIESYTIAKQLSATISFLMQDAVLIVIVSLLANVCTLLKYQGYTLAVTAGLMNHMFCLYKTDTKWLHAKRGSWLVIG